MPSRKDCADNSPPEEHIHMPKNLYSPNFTDGLILQKYLLHLVASFLNDFMFAEWSGTIGHASPTGDFGAVI